MNVLISADMEGISGVTSPADVNPGTPGWDHFRKIMTADVNAAVAGFYEAGARNIVVNDSHANMHNVVVDLLDPRATLISGRHKKHCMVEGVTKSTDAVAFIGYHTAAGQQGIMSHTYSGDIYNAVWLNEEICSEGYMNALFAAELGVPVVLVSGDDLTIEDAKRYAPDAGFATVKRCVDRFTAECIVPEKTFEIIKSAAHDGLSRLHKPEPLKGPFTFRIEFAAANQVIAATHIPGVNQTGTREATYTFDTMEKALRCFEAVTILGNTSRDAVYG
ncbi:unannotated protein [freshwater metagenome]|uniref:Unannotated protein n=1 Tax=freshwater metagenome TaxID=449393 RepID=A0A6J6KUA9_9ZZZZ|nr:peptide ABC transporter substrate-binding protein [Actinomycetota bacterium]